MTTRRQQQSDPARKKGHKSPEETRAALVAAFLRLLESQSVEAISVREVAQEAGVNHGLVHRYFGSKEALVRAAVGAITGQVFDDLPLERPSTWLFRTLRKNPAIAIIVARACLDGPVDLLDTAGPPPQLLDALIARLEQGLKRAGFAHIDPHLLNASFTSALLGWFVFRPLFERGGYRLPDDADDQLEALIAVIDAALDQIASPQQQN